MIIYKMEHKESGMVYIGQTIHSLARRTQGHLHSKVRSYVDRSLRKYGIDSFKIEKIDSAESRVELNEKEKEWIAYFDCMSPKGFNLTTGGAAPEISEETRNKLREAGKNISEETRTRMSDAAKNRPKEDRLNHSRSMKGRKTSDEVKEKLSNALMGIKKSPQTIENMRKAQADRSEETRKKISEHKKKYWAAIKAAKGGA